MKLSAKSRHGVAAMLDLAIKSSHRPVALVDVLDDQDISLSYLEQIFGRLKEGGLVEGVRGPRGGYRLARPVESISIAQVVRAVEDDGQRGRRNRLTGQKSQAHELWDTLSDRFYAFLEGISLADLLARAPRPSVGRFPHRRHYEDYPPRRRAA
jgi:Rrf2 family iron-sulfur cluster assembly transcriptional regulator